MKKYFALGFLVLGLLLLGCTAPGQQGAGGGTAGTGNTGASSSSSGGGGTSSGGETGGNSLAGLGYEQLIALGVPVECTVTESGQGTTTSLTLRIKGQKIRGEGTTTSQGVTTPTTFISLGNEMYVGIPAEQAQGPMAGCVWLKIVSNESNTTGSLIADPTDGLKAPGTDYSCAPGLFGDDVFVPGGNVCDFEALMNSMMGG